MNSNAEVLRQVTAVLSTGDLESARSIAQRDYPFIPTISAGRHYSEYDQTALFVRDGFVDRYSGKRLVFPGALRLLSHLLPQELPYQSNWKMSDCHIMYWELYPTLDHVIPVARGGKDERSNWVTTSQFRNSAKGNALLEEIGWSLQQPGDFREWDGLLAWFVSYYERDLSLLTLAPLRPWYRAAKRTLDSSR